MPFNGKKDSGVSGTLRGASEENGSPDRVVTVLAVSPYADDHLILRNIFSHSKWTLRTARTWHDARMHMLANPVSVILCEHTLPDADWRTVLNYLHSMPDGPMLVITARVADDHLWAEVLNLGAYDLLMKPFDHNEVVRVVSLAWLNWKDQRDRARRESVLAVPRLMAAGY